MVSSTTHGELTFQQIVESAPNALILVNSEGKIAYANKEAEKQFGYQRNELIGKNIELLIPERFSANHPRHRDQFFHTPEARSMGVGRDLFALRKDGTEFPVEIGLNPLVTVEGTMVLAAVIDITERKKAAELVRISESMYRNLFENLNNGFAYCKVIYENEKAIDFTYVTVNNAYESLTGLQNITGKNLTEVIPGLRESDPEYLEMITNVSLNGETVKIENFVPALDRWFLMTMYCPEKGYFIGLVDNITERKKFEEHLGLFASIVNSSDDAIISKTLDGNITSWNRGAEKLFGYTAAEIIGKNVSILIPTQRINDEPEIIERIKKGEYIDHYETQRIRKDGSLVYISLTVSPVINNNGKIIGASKIARDISERKKAEELVEKSERKYRALLENNNDAITLHDSKGEVFYQSPAVERITGYTLKDLKNKSALDMFHPDFVEAAKKRIDRAMKNSGLPISGISRLRHKEGHYIWTEGTTTNMLHDENVRALVGNFRDITNRKTDEEKIEKSNRLYAFLSGINQAIVHTYDEAVLFKEVCRVATEIGKFEMAWVGLVDEKTQGVSLVAQSNATENDIKLLTNARYDPSGPTAKVISTGSYHLSNDVESENEDSLWLAYIKSRNLSSLFILPIKRLGKIIGTFNIYSSVKNFFVDDEISLLIEAAGDISFALDVFEKEKRMAQSEARLKGAQHMAHLGDWEYNLQTREVIWSDENYRIYGLQPGSVSPSANLMLSFAHPDDVERIKAEVDNSLANYVPFSNFRRIVLKNGAIRHIYSTALFDFDENDKPIRFHGTTLDVTDITEKEEELRKSELRFREFFENAPEAITILDIEAGGTIVDANYNALKLLGYAKDELIGKTPADISPPMQPDGSSSDELAIEYINEALRGEKKVFEWVITNSDGRDYTTEVRLTKLPGMERDTLMVSFIDITERKNNEALQAKITADLMQRNKDLEQFTYIISHNLRGPVANIIGASDILEEPALDPVTAKKMLSSLSVSVNRLDDVIKDLNHILQVKKQVSEKNEMVKFSGIVDDIKISIAHLIKNENAVINCDFSAIDEFFTLKSYLYSIFYNLISNSIKYRQPRLHPVIEISSSIVNNKIVLIFKDNGLGIDLQKKQDQVFGLYKRFHLHAEGKGMGLYMTKTQVETMGGSISISSIVDQGTQFRIEFEINTEK